MTADAAPRQLPSPTELRAAADRLVSALAAHSDPEYRLTVLKRLVRRLGEERYPLFLRLLGVVAESDDARARRLLAETFGTARRRRSAERRVGNECASQARSRWSPDLYKKQINLKHIQPSR